MRYPLHRRTRQILRSLEKDYGDPLPILDCFELVADLEEKVRRCFEPAEIEHIEILDQPVHAGNSDFYALSYMASDFYDEFCRCFPGAPKMHEAAWLYASAHSMRPDVLERAWPDKEKLAWEIFRWVANSGVKPGQFEAIHRILNPPIPWPGTCEDASSERRGYGGNGWLVSELCKMKADPDYWRKGCPMLRALQEYRNCTLYGESNSDLRSLRWERWQTAACAEEQKSIRRLSEWLSAYKAARGSQDASEAESVPEAARGCPEGSCGGVGGKAAVE